MERGFLRWPGFKRKAITLSYDDAVIFDKRLIEIMDKYGLKGTFNINSGVFSTGEGTRRLTKQAAYSLYANSNHEVAAHGAKHYSLSMIPDSMIVNEIIQDRIALEEMFGRIVQGMAYANGACNDAVVDTLKKTGIVYARTTESTEKFDLPTNWLKWPATCHHKNPRLMELAKIFIEAEEGQHAFRTPPMLFYLWGHSYEFNDMDNWDVIEKFADYVGNREDVWYATNGEIYDYVKAFDNLQFSANGTRVYNPSAIDVYICYFKQKYLVPSGKTIEINLK